YLPQRHVKDGSVDYTTYLQNAVNNEKEITLPNYPIAVNWKGLQLKSNFRLVFQNESKLIMLPNSKTNYEIIGINNIENVEIIRPNLEGDKKKHLGEKGEWGMGLK